MSTSTSTPPSQPSVWTVEDASDRYAERIADYQLGLRWMRVAVPVILSKKQAAKVRRDTYTWLRNRFPTRFPKGYRFS